MIVDKDNNIKKIQVKSTGCKTKYGNYQVALKSCGGTKGITYKTVLETKVDELFVLTGNQKMYVIPINIIKNRSTSNICSKYKKYKVSI